MANIKQLVDLYELEELAKAEESLLNGKQPQIIMQSEDYGEQLTYVTAALWVKRDMLENNNTLQKSLQRFVRRIRESFNRTS